MMRPIKIRYLLPLILIAILLAILIVAWLTRITLAEYAISNLIDSENITVDEVEISQLDLGMTRLTQLVFRLDTDTTTYKFTVDNMKITYDTSSLASDSIHQLLVDKIDINVLSEEPENKATPADKNEIEPDEIVETYRQAFGDYLLFDRIAIELITFQDHLYRFNTAVDNKHLVADLAVFRSTEDHQKDNPAQTATIDLSENDAAIYLHMTADPPANTAELNLTVTEQGISGNYSIDPPQLRAWLSVIKDIPALVGMDQMEGTITIDASSDDTFITTLVLKTDAYSRDTVKLEQVELKMISLIPAVIPVENVRIIRDSYINIDKLQFDDVQLMPDTINISGDVQATPETWQLDAKFSSELLAVILDAGTLTLGNIGLQVRADPSDIEVQGSFSPASLSGKFDLTVDHNLENSMGRLSIKPESPIDLNEEDSKLSLLLSPWPFPFDLLTGSVNLAAEANWAATEPFRSATDVSIMDAGGNVDEILFSGLSLSHSLEITPELKSIKGSELKLAHIDSGITASNISAKIELQIAATGALPMISVKELYGEIFDGSFNAEEFIFDLNNKTNLLTVNATDIDLARVVETQQLDDIKVTGRIDGSIPIKIDEEGVTIEDGSFINDIRAGTIRYNPAAGTEQLKQNPLTGIALDALKDFRYSQLNAGVSYAADGKLMIRLHLQGTSPELDTDRPVNLNINTEQNLNALLKSLRFAEGVSSRIDDKVRRSYEESAK